ncbi:MAG: hypothetical protein IJ860_07605, partial [Eubacterium sp.]|nr:hypothetical protein [Eubacterium sp.]
QREPGLLPRVYLHMLLHCIFSHPFQYGNLDSKYWDFAADLAVENVILELNWDVVRTDGDRQRIDFLEELRQRAGKITAENLYHYFYLNPRVTEMLLREAPMFHRDIHRFWIPEEFSDNQEAMKKDNEQFDENSSVWGRLAKNVKMDVEAFEKNQGKVPDVLSDNIRAIHRGTYNYRTFLRKFVTFHEEMHISHEEFDYIYYTYGLRLYEKMPLIEPLEYRESRKIRDFVIAIDTSGSTMGRTVRNFLNQTYTILCHTDQFFDNMNVHVIQCDSRIQKDVTLTSPDEFARYLDEFELAGGGGTDFRPVFDYIEELQRSGSISELKGLLYFTDGLGTFPERMPDYQTAFIFLKGRQPVPKVPPWAMKLVLAEEDLAVSDRDYMEERINR